MIMVFGDLRSRACHLCLSDILEMQWLQEDGLDFHRRSWYFLAVWYFCQICSLSSMYQIHHSSKEQCRLSACFLQILSVLYSSEMLLLQTQNGYILCGKFDLHFVVLPLNMLRLQFISKM